MSDFEAFDGAEQFESHASDLAGVVRTVSLWKTRHHHVGVTDCLNLCTRNRTVLRKRLMPNTHRRRQRDSAVELSCVGGVYTIATRNTQRAQTSAERQHNRINWLNFDLSSLGTFSVSQ